MGQLNSACIEEVANGKYAHVSVCELILMEEKFSDMRHLVGKATAFWSHCQKEPYAGWDPVQFPNDQRWWRSTVSQIEFACLHGELGEHELIWLDYFSLRQNANDFHPETVVDLIGDIGRLVAAFPLSDVTPSRFRELDKKGV